MVEFLPLLGCVGLRGATECGLSADIRIRIRLQPRYGYHFFTSVNIHIRIQKLGENTDMVKAISYPYSIRYLKAGLDNDICMEETILQWNETIDFDILSR